MLLFEYLKKQEQNMKTELEQSPIKIIKGYLKDEE
jgi:hypothetical protein